MVVNFTFQQDWTCQICLLFNSCLFCTSLPFFLSLLLTKHFFPCFTLCFLPFLVPEDTAVAGSYVNMDMDLLGVGNDGHPAVVLITVTDPDKQVLTSHEALKKGKVAWTSPKDGEYTICVNIVNGSRTGRKFRFGLTFKQGKQEADYGVMAKQEHLSAIVVELRKLSDRTIARQQEQEYQKKLEERFRDETESMNSRVCYH